MQEIDRTAEFNHARETRRDFYDFILRLTPLILLGMMVWGK